MAQDGANSGDENRAERQVHRSSGRASGFGLPPPTE